MTYILLLISDGALTNYNHYGENANNSTLSFYYEFQELVLNRVANLMFSCPNFRGLDMFIDRIDGNVEHNKLSASNVLNILPNDWETI